MKALHMTRNVGNVDRMLRIIAGLAILSLVFFIDSSLRWWGLIGLVLLVTGLTRRCPAYSLFGIDSCGARRQA